MLCIRSLPGESASRERVVTKPYTTAQAAHTRATTTPWFVRKLLNRKSSAVLLACRARIFARTFVARIARRERLPGANAGAVYRAGQREGGWRDPRLYLSSQAPTAARSTGPARD